MSFSISTLLIRNLRDVFGENDPARRRAAIDELYVNRVTPIFFSADSTPSRRKTLGAPARPAGAARYPVIKRFLAVRTGAAAVKTVKTRISKSLDRQIDTLVEPGWFAPALASVKA
jgi:hypothetical protein